MESNKRKTPPQPIPKEECDILKITPLGAGQEVGRSCILVEFKEKKLLLDSGLHPAYSGLSALPYFDEIDPESIDLVLITHFHLDHAASLPYFMQKTTFKGRVFMTHPTRAIYKWLLSDYVKVSNLSTEDMLYTEQDLIDSFEKIEVIDYHQQVDVDGIKFTGYNAGHVLGAAMFLIEIAGVRILYTGDYSREEDRHLMAAERPKNIVPEVLICESTYGVQSHQPRLEREAMFTSLVHKTVGQGGRCLIPVFALGRAQELLLILDEYWQAHPQLHNIPIYYASSLAKRCMAVYQTYTNMMNEKIRKQIKENNPFHFKHISNLKGMRNFDDIGACVMMASPGMLQSGLSRELLEMWCTDKKNGVIIPGYVVEGTMAKQILSQPDEITSSSGAKLPLRLSVDYISFSAHVDYQQNSQFIEEVGSPNLVLVHGDSNEMSRLRGALQDRYSEREQPLNIYSPRNCDCVELYFRGEKMAKIIGSLASKPPTSTTPLSGILIAKDYQYTLVAPEDLNEFTHGKLNLVKIRQKMFVGYKSTWELVKWYFGMMFGNVEISKDGDCVTILSSISVTKIDDRKLELEWEGNSINDMISDSVVAIIIQAETSPASVKATKSAHSHSHSDTCQKKQPVTPVKKVRGRKKASTKIVVEDSDGQEDDTNVYEDEGLFGFYATILLGNHFGRENIKYYNKTTEEIDDALMVYIPDAEGGENSEQQVTARSFIIEKLGEGVHCWGIFIGDEEEGQVEFGVVLLQKGCEIIVYCKNAELKERISMVAGRINRTLRPVEDTWVPTTK